MSLANKTVRLLKIPLHLFDIEDLHDQQEYLDLLIRVGQKLDYEDMKTGNKEISVPVTACIAYQQQKLTLNELRIYVYLCLLAERQQSSTITLRKLVLEAISKKLSISKTAFKFSLKSLTESEFELLKQIDTRKYILLPFYNESPEKQ